VVNFDKKNVNKSQAALTLPEINYSEWNQFSFNSKDSRILDIGIVYPNEDSHKCKHTYTPTPIHM